MSERSQKWEFGLRTADLCLQRRRGAAASGFVASRRSETSGDPGGDQTKEACWRKELRTETDHVHDLDQAEREHHGQGLRVVGHRPLHPVVVLQEVLQQGPLVGALQRHYEEYENINLTNRPR